MDKNKPHINEASGKNYPEPDVPVEDAWNNMKEMLQLSAPTPPAHAVKTKSGSGKGIAGKFLGAAGIVITASVILYVIVSRQEDPKPSQVVYNSGATPKTDTLNDGTIAFLDTYSSIIVTSPANKEKRIILNKGGCYFRQINNEPINNWQLQVGSVAVIPAKANVYLSLDTASAQAVIQVQHGDAIIQSGEQKLQLAAGESVRFNTQKEIVLNKQKGDPNLYSYANKVFEFSNTSFKDAARLFEKAYDVKIVVKNPKLYNCIFTTRFDNQTLEQILDILGYTLEFEYRIDKKKNQVIISGDGLCN